MTRKICQQGSVEVSGQLSNQDIRGEIETLWALTRHLIDTGRWAQGLDSPLVGPENDSGPLPVSRFGQGLN